MMRYEALILAAPEITADESSALENQFEQFIKKVQGSLLSYERWGKYRLAFPVRNNEYGVYFLTRFELDEKKAGSTLKDIDSFFAVKNNAIVMRHMLSRLDSRAALTYVKPESLEDIPTQDVEHKVKGIFHNNAHDMHEGADHDQAEQEDMHS
jgi:small subunit ribosomal protein S6